MIKYKKELKKIKGENMKKILLSVFMVLSIYIYSDTCASGMYQIESGIVYYGFDMNPNPDIVNIEKKEEINGADSKTFKEMVDYGKDKNNVYYEGKKVKNADAKTFEILGYTPQYIFTAVCYFYGKDEKNIYYKGVILKEADVNTFKVSGAYEAEDKDYNYKGNERTKK